MLAIGFGVDVADDLRAGENRKCVVTANAFGGRGVNLPRVVEVPEIARETAVVDQRVEGSEEEGIFDFRIWIFDLVEEGEIGAEAVEGGAVFDGERLNEVGDEGEFVAGEADESALTEFQDGQIAGGFGGGRRRGGEDAGGEDAFGEIVDAALIAPVRDQDAAVEEEFLQRGFGEGGRAPDAAGAAGVGEVVGGKWTARGDFGEDAFGEDFFARGELAGPKAVRAGAALHGGEKVEPGFEREGDEDVGAGNVVFESEAGLARFWGVSFGFWVGLGGGGVVVVEVAHQVALAVIADAVAQDEIVHATADIDGVDLHVAHVSEGGGDVGDGRVEEDGVTGEAAGVKRGEDERSRSHG